MAILKLFSERNLSFVRATKTRETKFPRELLVQLSNIVVEVTSLPRVNLDMYDDSLDRRARLAEHAIAHEHGKPRLTTGNPGIQSLCSYLVINARNQDVFDLLEVVFGQALDRIFVNPIRRLSSVPSIRWPTLDSPPRLPVVSQDDLPRFRDAVVEVNYRFKQHGIPYELTQGEPIQVFRTSSSLLSKHTTAPVLELLSKDYAGADAEFRRALQHQRHRRNEEAIADCAKALESVLKVLCQRRGWPIPARPVASSLIDTVFGAGAFPPYLQEGLKHLNLLLKTCVPTVRNKAAAHGSGIDAREVPDAIVDFIVHSTGATLLLLTKL